MRSTIVTMAKQILVVVCSFEYLRVNKEAFTICMCTLENIIIKTYETSKDCVLTKRFLQDTVYLM